MNERDTIYGGYYQNIPGNIMYNNFGFQTQPGCLLNNGINNFQIPNIIDLNESTINPYIEINTRLNNLEQKVKELEQKLTNTDSYKDDNSMYMI